MNIFQISETLLDIYNEIEENGGEITDELEDELKITQEDFRAKVRDYVAVIKQIDADCDAIDIETKRLKTLKDSKKKLKERLSKIVCKAIDMFGEHTKSGGAYVELGTEKVSVRNTTKLETNDDLISSIAKDVVLGYADIEYTNGWDTTSINPEYFIERAKSHTETDDDGTTHAAPIEVMPSNYDDISAEIKISVPLSTLIGEKGVDFMKNLMPMTTAFNVTGSVNKIALKKEFKADDTWGNNIAKIVPNQSLSIK